MHVGKAVEGEGTREGLYIRSAFTLSPSPPRLQQISSTENQNSILTHNTLVVTGGWRWIGDLTRNLILHPIRFDVKSVNRQGSQFGRGVWQQIVGETAEQGTSNLHFNCNGFW